MMMDSCKAVAVKFPRGDANVVVNNPSFYGRSILVVTTLRDNPVPNICSSCNRPYYDILNVSSKSIGSSAVKIHRCPHSNNILPYVKPI